MHMYGIQKNATDEPICKVEMETQMERTNVWTQRGERRGGMNWEIGKDIYTILILYIKQITNENLLYGTRNSTQCCGDVNVNETQKRGEICIHMADSLCCTVETNTTL